MSTPSVQENVRARHCCCCVVGEKASYLIDIALLWWRGWYNDERQGAKPITCWLDFIIAFHKQLFLDYVKGFPSPLKYS